MGKTIESIASFGRMVRILKDTIETQVEALAQDCGCTAKAPMLSPILLLAEDGALTAADIARRLDDSHQLTTQRINWLIQNKYAKTGPNKEDARSRSVTLTAKGKKEAEKVVQLSAKLEQAYQGLFAELESDLLKHCRQAVRSLIALPLRERVENEEPS